MGLLGRFRPAVNVSSSAVREVLRGFVPVVITRGVVQLSAYVDLAYASLLSERAFAALTHAQTIYLLPISLFGMAVSAAELPAMSQVSGTHAEVSAALRGRIDNGLARIAIMVVPSAMAFLLLGDLVAAALFQNGHFHATDARYVWYILMGAAVGLLASTMGRLYTSAFYALRDRKTPLKLAVARVTLTAALAYVSVRFLPAWLGVPRDLGAVGITASTGFVAWLEYLMLGHLLGRRIGPVGPRRGLLPKLWLAASASGAFALVVKWTLGRLLGFETTSEWGSSVLMSPAIHPLAAAGITLSAFAIVWLVALRLLGIPFSLRALGRGPA